MPWLLVSALSLVGCIDASTPSSDVENHQTGDLSPGLVETDKLEDGDWGDATICKEVPFLEPLKSPAIVVVWTV